MGQKGRFKSLGFTLVEVIVALAVFVIVATFAFPIFLSSLNVNVAAHEKTQIQEASQNYMEYIVSISESYQDNAALISHLESITIYGDTTFNVSLNTLTVVSERYTITVLFEDDSSLIRLEGLSIPNNHTFETVEWLAYGT